MSVSEAPTLALSCQWFGRSERAFLRYATAHWRRYFPRLLRRCRGHVAAKPAALNLGIWVNRYLGRPPLALATLFNG